MSTVSIIIPLFNKAAYISQTLSSVIAQTHADFECIVVDNGSTDGGTAEVVAVEDPRVRLASFTTSRGPGATRNAGLREAQGDWILFLDADDVISLNHLFDLLTVADQDDRATLIAGKWLERNATLSDAGIAKSPPSQPNLEQCIIAAAPWAVHAAIIKRESTPQWSEELDSLLGEDIAFWFAAVRQNTIAYAESSGAIYRTQTENCRTQSEDIEAWFAGVDAAIDHNIQKAGEISPAQCEHLVRAYQQLYGTALRKENAKIASTALQRTQFWLAKRAQLPSPLSRNIRLRKWLGIPLYHRITNWFHHPAGSTR